MAPGIITKSPTSAESSPTHVFLPTKQVSPPSTPTSVPVPTSGQTIAPRDDRKKPNFLDLNDRLRSFGSWPPTAPVSKDKVARAGFYYLGSGLETACPFCKVEVSDWVFDDVALRKHRERSPKCPFVLQQTTTNVPLEELMKRPEKRLETFARWPKPEVNPHRLVNAGFYSMNEADKVRCAWCKGVIEHWNVDDVPFVEHAKNFPCCPFILNPPEYATRGEDECGHHKHSSRNVSSEGRVGTSGKLASISPHLGPKHPHMVSTSTRLSTFNSSSWPQCAHVKPDDLVQAGFFYLGMYDYTKCFHCDGGLCNWEEGDDPWVEHARWFPHCKFVLLNKGEAFVQDCEQKHNQLLAEMGAVASSNESSTEGQGDTNLPPHLRTELETIMQSADVKFYLEKGVPREVVRMTLKKFMMDKVRGFNSHDEMSTVLAQVLSFGKRMATEAPITEQRNPEDIPENILCRVCMIQERGVVFLPCGHLVACPSCASSVTDCVVCRTPIEGCVRTYLS